MSYIEHEAEKWGALWHSKNKVDGVTEHILRENCVPVLFRTRQEARDWIEEKYGYLKHRKDLRSEPHGWKLPKPVKVKITVIPEKEKQ